MEVTVYDQLPDRGLNISSTGRELPNYVHYLYRVYSWQIVVIFYQCLSIGDKGRRLCWYLVSRVIYYTLQFVLWTLLQFGYSDEK